MTTSQAAGANHNPDVEIGNRIANALIVKGKNVKSLSDITGISYPTLRRSLTGGRSLTIREITSIADAISVPASALLPDTLTQQAAA
jgi:transcriptional regulator with XRE-family HTH domain